MSSKSIQSHIGPLDHKNLSSYPLLWTLLLHAIWWSLAHFASSRNTHQIDYNLSEKMFHKSNVRRESFIVFHEKYSLFKISGMHDCIYARYLSVDLLLSIVIVVIIEIGSTIQSGILWILKPSLCTLFFLFLFHVICT